MYSVYSAMAGVSMLWLFDKMIHTLWFAQCKAKDWMQVSYYIDERIANKSLFFVLFGCDYTKCHSRAQSSSGIARRSCSNGVSPCCAADSVGKAYKRSRFRVSRRTAASRSPVFSARRGGTASLMSSGATGGGAIGLFIG